MTIREITIKGRHFVVYRHANGSVSEVAVFYPHKDGSRRLRRVWAPISSHKPGRDASEAIAATVEA